MINMIWPSLGLEVWLGALALQASAPVDANQFTGVSDIAVESHSFLTGCVLEAQAGGPTLQAHAAAASLAPVATGVVN